MGYYYTIKSNQIDAEFTEIHLPIHINPITKQLNDAVFEQWLMLRVFSVCGGVNQFANHPLAQFGKIFKRTALVNGNPAVPFVALVITGFENIVKAIDQILLLDQYQAAENKNIFTHLEIYQEFCRDLQKQPKYIDSKIDLPNHDPDSPTPLAISIAFPFHNDTMPAVVDYLKKHQLFQQAFVASADENGRRVIRLRVNGYRRVKYVIDWLLEHQKNFLSTADVSAMRERLKICEQALAKKLPRQMALFSRPISDFEETEKTVIANVAGDKTYSIYQDAVDLRLDKNLYVMKPNLFTGRSQTEIEVFAAYCYRLFCPNFPKVVGLHDEENNRRSVAARYMPGFFNLAVYGDQLTLEKLITMNFARIWVTALFLSEIDLNYTNLGVTVDEKGGEEAANLDSGRALWPLTSRYYGIDPTLVNQGDVVSPNDSFPIDPEDIVTFPNLQKAKPAAWVTSKNYVRFVQQESLQQIASNKDFCRQKYAAWLDIILAPASIFVAFGVGSLSSPKVRERTVNYVQNRQAGYKEVLLNLPQFQDYFRDNCLGAQQEGAFARVEAEFARFNASLDPEEKSVQVDIEMVRKNFADVASAIELASMTERLKTLPICS